MGEFAAIDDLRTMHHFGGQLRTVYPAQAAPRRARLYSDLHYSGVLTDRLELTNRKLFDKTLYLQVEKAKTNGTNGT